MPFILPEDHGNHLKYCIDYITDFIDVVSNPPAAS